MHAFTVLEVGYTSINNSKHFMLWVRKGAINNYIGTVGINQDYTR